MTRSRQAIVMVIAAAVWAGLLTGCGASLDPTGTIALGSTEPHLAAKPAENSASWVSSALGSQSQPSTSKPFTGVRPTPTTVAAGDASVATSASDAYKIGPLDVIDVAVYKVPQLSMSVQVAETGTVSLPLVGEVVVGGRTPQEVERELVKRLGAKYLQRPQVNVYVKEYNSRRVTLEGAIKSPGVHPLKGRTTLLQAVASAGGLTDTADSTIVVFRQVNGKRSAARFDIAQIRSGETTDPDVQPGDVIIVSNSMVKEGLANVLKLLPLAGLFAIL